MRRRRFRYPLIAGQWWLLAAPLMVLLPEYCAPILAIALFSFACRDAAARGATLLVGRAGKPILLYILWMAIGSLYSHHPLNTLASTGMWSVLYLGYLGLNSLLCNRRRIERFCWLLSVAGGVCGLLAVMQYIGVTVLSLPLTANVWDAADALFYRDFPIALDFYVPGVFRAAGTYNNPNLMAICLVMVLPFAFTVGFSGHRSPRRIVSRFCILFAIAGIAVSFCRGAYLALLMIAGIYLLFLPERGAPLLLAGSAAVSCIPAAIIDRFLSIGSSDRSITHRLAMWRVGLQQSAEKPLLGYGAGVSNTTDMLAAAGIDAPHMHNTYIQVLIEGGLPALLLLSAVAYFYLRTPMELLIRRRQRRLAVALVAGAVGSAVCGMFDFLFFTPKLVGLVLLVIALVDSTCRVELTPSAALPPLTAPRPPESSPFVLA